MKATYFVLIILMFIACDSKPRVIEATTSSNNTATPSGNITANDIPAFRDVGASSSSNTPTTPTAAATANEHKVVVEEVLNTTKYSYLYVKEGEEDEKFWIAISKREVTVGETYYYKGGLLKKNFYSQEYDRTFEKVYLVGNLWQKKASNASTPVPKSNHENHTVDLTVGDITPAAGAIQLSELFNNKAKYNGQTVKISGKVVKVNPMIMKRNWLHLKDSSGDEYDLTVTTTESIPLGAVLTLEGTIALDKDFGAGYRYDIIMEGAVLK